jgi:protoporphyrinogen oxidase
MTSGTAVIIGAGPAGLTAAYELLERTGIRPIVLEASDHMGGLSKTVDYKGNRIDIGGHRFFSKSDRVMEWWLNILPMQKTADPRQTITYHRRSTTVSSNGSGPDPETEDRVMLIRSRRSRIFFGGKFYDYPISLSVRTLANMGLLRSMAIGFSYIRSVLFPIRNEQTLEDFFINRFGRELYETFFKSYTEKVWGVPCHEISAAWGAQRVKGLSIRKAIVHFVRQLFARREDIAQKQIETSLIEQFLYPKYGPGQMWDCVARLVTERGGEVRRRHIVTAILTNDDGSVRAVRARSRDTSEEIEIPADYVFSSMPVQALVQALDAPVPADVADVAKGLVYRDFITVGLLLDRLKISEADGQLIRDNWIYIQEPYVKVGRLQIFNNWSPYMVADRSKVWVGLEYFCNATDPMWTAPDEELKELAATELEQMGLADRSAVRDGVVIRVAKTYPAYFGTYDRFARIREFVDRVPNLFLVGRNGMHRYNNQDHSMLTAMTAVDNIIAGRTDKANIWDINTEEEYHEEK